MRKDIHFKNRYWKRIEGGWNCDACGHIIIGWLSAYKNKKTLRILCRKCYLAGK